LRRAAPVESTGLVTEELALEKLTRQGGAIDFHERRVVARRNLVELASHDLFPCTAFTLDENRDVGAGDLLEKALHLGQVGAVPHGFFVGSLILLVLGEDFGVPHPLVNGRFEGGFVYGLGEIVVGPQSDGFYHRARLFNGGEHQHPNRVVELPDLLQGRQTIVPGHDDIENDCVRSGAGLQQGHGPSAVLYGVDLEAATLQELRHDGADPVGVVDHHDARFPSSLVALRSFARGRGHWTPWVADAFALSLIALLSAPA
jgi:hypothetical protein